MDASGDVPMPENQLQSRSSRVSSSVENEVPPPPTEPETAESVPQEYPDANNTDEVQPLYRRIWNYQPNPDAAWMQVMEQTGIPGVVEIARPQRHITVR